MTDAYVISTGTVLLRDTLDEPGRDIDALVASGDCFITLATQLDALSFSQPAVSQPHPEIENVVRTLVYLQRHYTIAKKHSNFRQ